MRNLLNGSFWVWPRFLLELFKLIKNKNIPWNCSIENGLKQSNWFREMSLLRTSHPTKTAWGSCQFSLHAFELKFILKSSISGVTFKFKFYILVNSVKSFQQFLKKKKFKNESERTNHLRKMPHLWRTCTKRVCQSSHRNSLATGLDGSMFEWFKKLVCKKLISRKGSLNKSCC